jgi:hypothetical protein
MGGDPAVTAAAVDATPRSPHNARCHLRRSDADRHLTAIPTLEIKPRDYCRSNVDQFGVSAGCATSSWTSADAADLASSPSNNSHRTVSAKTDFARDTPRSLLRHQIRRKVSAGAERHGPRRLEGGRRPHQIKTGQRLAENGVVDVLRRLRMTPHFRSSAGFARSDQISAPHSTSNPALPDCPLNPRAKARGTSGLLVVSQARHLLGGEVNRYSHRNFHSSARIVSVNNSSTVNARGRRPCFTAKSITISRERRLASMPKRSGSRSGTPVAAKEAALASRNRR